MSTTTARKRYDTDLTDERWSLLQPQLKKVLADDGYSGQPMVDHVQKERGWEFESVKRTELHRFKVILQRWVVERTIGWMNNFRGIE